MSVNAFQSALPQPRLPAYILAGGRSRRFGSDKARALHEGRPLLRGVADGLASVCAPVIAVADVAGKYDDLGVSTIADATPGLGPVGGLFAAMGHAEDDLSASCLFLASCDLLRVPTELLTRLQAPLGEPQPPLAVCFGSGSGSERRLEPTFAIYAAALRPAVERLLAPAREGRQRGPSLHAVLESAKPRLCVLPLAPGALSQANRPEELPQARSRPS